MAESTDIINKEKIRSVIDSMTIQKKIRPQKFSKSKQAFTRQKSLNIEINTTDSAQLTRIYGIGPSFAKRIIKYRNLLGGYCKKEQLLEVYGLDSLKFNQIKHHFINCNLAKIRQINFNQAEFKELLKHPYLSFDFVKRIVNARRKENFESAEDLLKRGVLPDSLYQKIQPYIKIK